MRSDRPLRLLRIAALALALGPAGAARGQEAPLPPAVWEAHYKKTLECFGHAHDYHRMAFRQLRADAAALEEVKIELEAATIKRAADVLSGVSALDQTNAYNGLAKAFRNADELRRNLYRCTSILHYLAQQTLAALFADGQQIQFWATAWGVGPEQFAIFLAEDTPIVEVVSNRPYESEVRSVYRTRRMGASTLLHHGVNAYASFDFLKADEARRRATHPSVKFGSTEERNAALKRADAEWCRASKDVFGWWYDSVKDSHDSSAAGFDRVGSALVELAMKFVSAYRAYASEAIDYLNTELAGSPRSPLVAELTKQANEDYHRLIDELLSPRAHHRWSVATFLSGQARWYRNQRKRQENMVVDRSNQISVNNHCGVMGMEPAEKLATLQTKPIRKALSDARKAYDRDLWPPDARRCVYSWIPKHSFVLQAVSRPPATVTECLIGIGTGTANVAGDGLRTRDNLTMPVGAGGAAGRASPSQGRAKEPDDGNAADGGPDGMTDAEWDAWFNGVEETASGGTPAPVSVDPGAGGETGSTAQQTVASPSGPRIRNMVIRRQPAAANQPVRETAAPDTPPRVERSDGPRIRSITIRRSDDGR